MSRSACFASCSASSRQNNQPLFVSVLPLARLRHPSLGLHGSQFHGSGRWMTPKPARGRAAVVCEVSSQQEPRQSISEPLRPDHIQHSFPAFYQSWRNPKWLHVRQVRLLDRNPPIRDPSSYRPLFVLPKYKLFYRLTCATSLLTILGLACVSYVRLNRYVALKVSRVAEQTLHRQIQVGRVARCNPFTGIILKDVYILPSQQRPTAPVISASTLQLKLTGFMTSLFTGKPLALDIFINRAHVQLSQIVITGPKGLPVGQWDPGDYNHLLNHGTRPNKGEDRGIQTATKLLRFVQPGKLSVHNSLVRFVPADFLDYGHGSEGVDVQDAKAIITFPTITASQDPNLPIKLDGDFKADVKGIPVEGGTIAMQCFSNGNKLLSIQPEDVAVTLRVSGQGVRAARIASFLSLPFRADEGHCAADISMDFLYKSESLVPIMNGEAVLNDVALRFHPDPKTPEFRKINGKLRFKDKSMFFEGPVGELGSLPMTVEGDIHLEDGYNLMGYAHQVDVNNILDTFDVEKFVPVEGQVRGEAHMTGVLEEPVVRGWAQSVGEYASFDRLPLTDGKLCFEWDAIAGLLRFSDITASVTGGGNVVGEGTLFFDMTKPSPFGISRDEHSPRTPKALYWNPDVDQSKTPPLPPPPEDPLEIDDYAPFRPYDSMMFNFKVSDVDGGNLLKWYGGAYGRMATKAVGLVSGEGVLAGHAKDANCRVVWKSTTSPPEVLLNPKASKSASDAYALVAATGAKNDDEDKRKGNSGLAPDGKADGKADESVVPADNRDQSSPFPHSSFLGGGSYRGLVYIKLGDPLEARRIKVRTIVKGFDARRAGWSDNQLRVVLRHTPLLETSADTYFKGVMFQRPILSPGVTSMPRTPRMELLGVDGALAVRKLSLNDVVFPDIMTGSFSFSVSDFSISLKERDVKNRKAPVSTNERLSSNGKTHGNLDELTLSASLKGNAFLRLRLGSTAADADISRNEQGDVVAVVSSENLKIHNFIGSSNEFLSGEAVRGTLDMNMGVNLNSRTGKGRIYIRDPSIGTLALSSVGGEVLWRDQNVFLRRGNLKYRNSEYRVNAGYELPLEQGSDFKWNMNVKVQEANVRDIAQLVVSGNAVARALQSPVNSAEQSRIIHPNGPLWIQRLSQSHESDIKTTVQSWKVPTDVPFAEEVAYYRQMIKELQEPPKPKARKKPYVRTKDKRLTLADLRGDVTGVISVKYDSRLGEISSSPSAAGVLLQAALDQLTRTSFSFRLVGADWAIGDIPIDNVQALASFEEGVLDIGTTLFQHQRQFGAEVECRLTSAGSLQASAMLDNAPADLVNRYVQAPVDIDGACSGRLQVEGNITNPRALGRLVWTNASLNGKQVHGARTDLACVNGRCLLNVNARIGGPSKDVTNESDKERLSSLFWNDKVITALQDMATRTGSKFEGQSEASLKHNAAKREGEEAVSVRVSAPVRFYVRRYVQRRTSGTFWSLVEPVLGGAYPIDDEWVLADVNVKKYGLLLLNTVLPELGWDRGDSDISLRLSGTLPKPIIEGRVTVSDGVLWPAVLSEPLHSLRGELIFCENGLMSLKYLNGRCASRSLTAHGDMFLSESHEEQVEAELLRLQQMQVTTRKTKSLSNRKRRRELIGKINFAKSCLSKASRGFHVDLGDVPINYENALSSRLSAKVDVKGTVTTPEIGGWVVFSDGEIVLSNAGLSTRSALRSSTPSELAGLKWRQDNEAMGRAEAVGKVGSEAQLKMEVEDRLRTRQGEIDSANGSIAVRGFTVHIGRGMRVVQPLVLKVDVSGKVMIDGTVGAPRATGEINFGSGSVNVLASKMWMRRGEKNFIRFTRGDANGGGERSGDAATVQLALEDDDFVVRVAECAPQQWMQHVTVEDKRTSRGDGGEWGETVVGEWRSGLGWLVRKVVENYASDVLSVGSRAGAVEWKLFPSVVEEGEGGGEGAADGRNVGKELAAAAQVEVGGVTVRAKRSVGGVRALRVAARVLRALSVHVEAVGARLRVGCALVLREREGAGQIAPAAANGTHARSASPQ
eukprot:TRINITY_DN12417_c0_g1_i1.p1 TRINITY_DN12417_c0_g1~~TRINITY_DN12417_c0_g1_i1.p1  ORF type:complete len:2024 (+),score=274.42 TRINITY_DN12417_c0_g1_i1:261-6332(+)